MKPLTFHYHFTVKDGDKERVFAIAKMNRKTKEAADLFYSSTVSKYIKAGILPRAAYETTLKNLGGTVSDKDKEEHEKNKSELVKLSLELGELNLKKDEDKTAEELKSRADLEIKIRDLQEKILLFESSQFLIYENTAEAKARNKTITWLLLHLSYEKIGDKYEPIFKANDLEGKLDEYEDIQDNDFSVSVLSRLNYLITLWFLGRIETEEDFIKFDKESTAEATEDKVSEAKVEPANTKE